MAFPVAPRPVVTVQKTVQTSGTYLLAKIRSREPFPDNPMVAALWAPISGVFSIPTLHHVLRHAVGLIIPGRAQHLIEADNPILGAVTCRGTVARKHRFVE